LDKQLEHADLQVPMGWKVKTVQRDASGGDVTAVRFHIIPLLYFIVYFIENIIL
jgi:hypothetical protein